MWPLTTTTDFDQWFTRDLSDEERKEVTAVVNLLKLFGPMLKRPHADTLKGSKYQNMKELRAKSSRSELRIAFAFDTERFIDRADRLFAAHLAKIIAAKRKGKGE
jgi:hypothetical protein